MKIRYIGWIFILNGKYRIKCINFDGSLAPDFSHDYEFENINVITVQSDHKVLVGSKNPGSIGNATRIIIRLNADGTKDTEFNPNNAIKCVFEEEINDIYIDQNGKILVSGQFTSFLGPHFTRLNPDGSLDTTFDPDKGFDGYIVALAIQDDANIIVGGGFTSFNGVGRNRIARLIGSTGVLIPETIPDQPIFCYPNPTTGKVNIQLDKYYPDLSLTLVDIYGRTIIQKYFVDTQNIELELRSQPGLYFVTINSADGWIKTIQVLKK